MIVMSLSRPRTDRSPLRSRHRRAFVPQPGGRSRALRSAAPPCPRDQRSVTRRPRRQRRPPRQRRPLPPRAARSPRADPQLRPSRRPPPSGTILAAARLTLAHAFRFGPGEARLVGLAAGALLRREPRRLLDLRRRAIARGAGGSDEVANGAKQDNEQGHASDGQWPGQAHCGTSISFGGARSAAS